MDATVNVKSLNALRKIGFSNFSSVEVIKETKISAGGDGGAERNHERQTSSLPGMLNYTRNRQTKRRILTVKKRRHHESQKVHSNSIY